MQVTTSVLTSGQMAAHNLKIFTITNSYFVFIIVVIIFMIQFNSDVVILLVVSHPANL